MSARVQRNNNMIIGKTPISKRQGILSPYHMSKIQLVVSSSGLRISGSFLFLHTCYWSRMTRDRKSIGCQTK